MNEKMNINNVQNQFEFQTKQNYVTVQYMKIKTNLLISVLF
jgi:hypothetical protein